MEKEKLNLQVKSVDTPRSTVIDNTIYIIYNNPLTKYNEEI